MPFLKFVLMLVLAAFALAVAAGISLAVLAFVIVSPTFWTIAAAVAALFAWKGAKSLYRGLK